MTNSGRGASSAASAVECCSSSACRCAYSSGKPRCRMFFSVSVTGSSRPTCSTVRHSGHLRAARRISCELCFAGTRAGVAMHSPRRHSLPSEQLHQVLQ